ncbi:MAG TPA: FtsX-like permease family protein, partial [Candidatus Angelobacter sp.]|nr:FtsX-like permease family protein [Candidatus Angelobacter sp.]
RIAVGFAGVIAPANTIGTLTIPMDRSVLLFSVGVGLLSALLAGIAPAWAIAGSKSFAPLKEGGRTGTVSKGRQRARSLLVVGEIGLALVLLVGAGLFLKSLVRLQQLNPGFDPRGVMTAAVTLVPRAYASDAKQEAFYLALTQNLAHQPGIDAAGVAFGMPFSNLQGGSSFDIEGRQLGPGDPGPHSDLAAVTGGFFQTLSIPLRAGRYFTDQDNATSEPVAIIDETLARQYWPGQSPIGQRIKNGGPKWSTIVGVVAHVNRSALAGDSGKGLSYYSLLQIAIPMSHVVVRTSGNPASAGDVIRQAVKTVDPSQAAAYEFKPMQDRVAASLGPRRFAANMLTTFAAIALLMAAIGLYGVISYSVAQRTQEIGIRMALGARMSQVLYMIFAHAMGLVLAGIAIGLVAGALLARLLSAELVQVSAFDPLTFLGMSALLVVVTLAATYLPARRAAKVDPMVALRYE